MQTLEKLRDFCGRHRPRIALILGSGWGELAARCEVEVELSYREIPDLGATTVPGHRGKVLLGSWGDEPVILFSGRLHSYEGQPTRKVLQPVQLAHFLGAEVLVLTNAAGGIRRDLPARSLMAMTGHLSWIGPDAWRRLAADARGAVVSEPYCPELRQKLLDSARTVGVPMTTGVYAQVTGPCYETPSEVRALRACGADAVGMSTGTESEAAHGLGLRCLALSCITNAAAGLACGPIHHEEVTTIAGEKTEELCAVLGELLKRLNNTSAGNSALLVRGGIADHDRPAPSSASRDTSSASRDK